MISDEAPPCLGGAPFSMRVTLLVAMYKLYFIQNTFYIGQKPHHLIYQVFLMCFVKLDFGTLQRGEAWEKHYYVFDLGKL